MHKQFISLIFTFAILYMCGCNSKESEKSDSKLQPNIIWIIVEDLSPDIGCYGNDLVKTPVLDQLSTLGTRYTNVFATGPACSPSRTALSVGHYQNSIGAHHMRFPEELTPELPKDVVPIQALLNNYGYQTANIKNRPGNGKTDWLFSYDTNSYDVEKWEDIDSSKPFFARINLGLTHRGFVRDKENPIDYKNVEVPPYYPDHPVAKKDWRNYYESIQVLDRQIEKVLSAIKSNHLEENTLIFFFSDHGRPMIRGKNTLYDSGTQIPLIVASYNEKLRKKYLKKQVDDQLISLMDINATTLELVGMAYNSEAQSFLNQKKKDERKVVYSAVDRIGDIEFKSRSVRTTDFKYIRNYRQHISINSGVTAYRKANHPIYHLLNILNEKETLNEHQKKLLENLEYEELYDLKNDPYELNNLVNNQALVGELEELRSNLDSWMSEIADKGLKEDSKEIIKAFNDYGEVTTKKLEKNIQSLEQRVRNEVEANN